MSTNLPGFVIASLYKNTLVITSDIEKNTSTQGTENKPAAEHKTMQAAEKKRFLGDNKRGIIILVEEEGASFINDEHLETLTKLLDALKINLADVAIINIKNYAVSFTQLQNEMAARYILMFGVTPQQLQMPFAFPQYQVHSYSGCTLLAAGAATLASAANTTDTIKAEKRRLWDNLKKINF